MKETSNLLALRPVRVVILVMEELLTAFKLVSDVSDSLPFVVFDAIFTSFESTSHFTFEMLRLLGTSDESAPIDDSGDGGRHDPGPTTVDDETSESDPGPELAPLPVTSLKHEDS